MGLYDEVNFEMNCPICGQKVNDFQTKDVGCCMSTIEIKDLPGVARFYGGCNNCGLWIEFRKDAPDFRERQKAIDKLNVGNANI